MTPGRGGARKNRSAEESFRVNKSSKTSPRKRLEREARTRVRVSSDIRRRSRHAGEERQREERGARERAVRGAIMARTNKREGLIEIASSYEGRERASERARATKKSQFRRRGVRGVKRCARHGEHNDSLARRGTRTKERRKEDVLRGEVLDKKESRLPRSRGEIKTTARRECGGVGEAAERGKKETRAAFNVSFGPGIVREDSALPLLRLLLIPRARWRKADDAGIFVRLATEER